MGMYTQARGWLNVDSISYGGKNLGAINGKLKEAQATFENVHEGRSWVCEDTLIHSGGNGSIYIFFGTELKNYDDDAEEWVKHLIKHFPSAEGRIDFQYEEEDYNEEGSQSKYWLIREGKLIEEGYCKTWCYGYGNDFNKDNKN